MKKTALYLLLPLCCMVLHSCSKNGGSGSAPSYTVSGLNDITVNQYADTTISVTMCVAYKSGTAEQVTLTPVTDSLPAGVTVSPGSGNGTPSFATTFTFHIAPMVYGTFPIVIAATSTTTGTQHFRFNLVVTQGTPLSYTLSPIANITLTQYTDTVIAIPVTATYLAGTNDTVTITPDSLAAGITFTPVSVSGRVTFSGALQMHVAINTPGTYRVAVHTSSPSSGTKYFSFNVVIAAAGACAPQIAGTYSISTTCIPSLIATSSTAVLSATGVTNQIQINAAAGAVIFLADLNCNNGTLGIEASSDDDFTWGAGSGTFNASQVVATYIITSAGGTNYSCVSTYTR